MKKGTIAGIFVGGLATRLGGRAKGLLQLPSGMTIVERWVCMLETLDLPTVLVGVRDEYAHLPFDVVADDPPGIGPLGGLLALLRRADGGRVLALACDMPFVSRGIVERLLLDRDASAVAPRRDGRWEPLCAIYDARRVLPIALARAASGSHSLQGLLGEARAIELPLSLLEADELLDWDTPEDIRGQGT